MASIHHNTQANHTDGPPRAFNRRACIQWLVGSTAAGAIGTAAYSITSSVKNIVRGDELLRLTNEFPSTLEGATHENSIIPLPMPGSKQCLVVVRKAHEPEIVGLQNNLSLEQRARIRETQQLNNAMLQDLQTNYPQYFSGIAYPEGVAPGQERDHVPQLIQEVRNIADTERNGIAVDERHKEFVHYHFHQRFGSIASFVLSGTMEIRGCDSPNEQRHLDRIEWQRFTVKDLNYQQLRALEKEHQKHLAARLQDMLDVISEGNERFPLFIIGTSDPVVHAIGNWNDRNKNKPPFSAVILTNDMLATSEKLQRQNQ